MSCQNIRFGFDNVVPRTQTLIKSPESSLPIENIKTTSRSDVALWDGLGAEQIIIVGTMPEATTADFISIPESNLPPGSTVQFELYTGDHFTGTEILNADPIVISGAIPLGVWRAGIDPYGGESDHDVTGAIMLWFDTPKTFDTYRIVITTGFGAATSTPNTKRVQDATTGIVSMESSDGVVSNDDYVNTWGELVNVVATNGNCMNKIGTDVFYNAKDAPKLTFDLQATVNGQVDVWVKARVQNSDNLHYISINGLTSLQYVSTEPDFEWVKWNSLTLVKGRDYTIDIIPRDATLQFDKLVIQPLGTAAPTGDGPAVSPYGTGVVGGRISLRMLYIGRSLMMDKNFSYGNSLRLVTDPDIEMSALGHALSGQNQRLTKKVTVNLDGMTDADKIGLAMMETSMLGKPFMVSVRPGSSEWNENTNSFLANFATALDYGQVLSDKHQVQVNLLEV